MNCPSRVDPEALDNGWNQQPHPYSLDSNADANGIANSRTQRNHRLEAGLPLRKEVPIEEGSTTVPNDNRIMGGKEGAGMDGSAEKKDPVVEEEEAVSTAYGAVAKEGAAHVDVVATVGGSGGAAGEMRRRRWPGFEALQKAKKSIKKFGKFIGPGFMVAVAYIDPGNYATDVAAGASYKYRLLVMVLVSNLIAIFLQSLCIKLGSVTGLNLAENIKAHCPPWLNIVLWIFGEAAIIATDIAEVIGTAIALNLLLKVPLVAGCAISIFDVLIILIFYKPSGTMRGLRVFELFVMALVLGVVVCFCIELSLISVPDVGTLFKGYLPSDALVQSRGLYQACGILGATVMPHSLYLGSGLVQPRLREYDEKRGLVPPAASTSSPGVPRSISLDSDLEHSDSHEHDSSPDAEAKYKPSIRAIRSCLNYSIAELAIQLFTFALFVNSAILIVAGASLYNTAGADSADLFGIHALLSSTLSPGAGVVFGLALLLSGTSAGIVCTIAGQMVAEGQLNWTVKPWVRRLMTRSISITPSIIIAGAVGRTGLSAALEGSQVALSVILPFTSAPLIYFTCRNKFMTVRDGELGEVKMGNHWITAVVAVLVWVVVVIMNVATLVLLAMGKE